MSADEPRLEDRLSDDELDQALGQAAPAARRQARRSGYQQTAPPVTELVFSDPIELTSDSTHSLSVTPQSD
ncbi:MAG: hypothetical protein HY791_32470 [Deltaproteobacteria bacterium]|nr:hypothetical protein [Deltaproteobacteria bacterium]